MLAVVGGLVVGRVADDDRPGAAAAARPVDRRRPSPRLRYVVRSPLMRLVAIAYVLLAILGFSVTYPLLLAASETFTTRGRPGDGPRRAVGGRDRHLVRRVGGAGQPGLRAVRRHRRGPPAADRLPRRLRAVAGRLLVLDRGALPVHPAGHPARHLQLRLERVLQRGPAGASSPGAGLQRRRARPGRDDPLGPPAAGPGRSWPLDQVFWLGVDHRHRVHDRRGRHPATLSRERPREPADRPGRAGPRGRAGPAALARDPAVSDTLIAALAHPSPDPADGREAARPRARSSGRGRR